MGTDSLLAIGFSSPFFPALGGWLGTALAAAGLASIPVIIHLLNKRRFREREWAAIKFLLAALKKNARRLRLEQLLLLAVRVLLVMLLAGAVAKPYLERQGLSFRTGVRYHKVIVLDGSFSMGYQPAQRSRFERAKDVARQILEESNKGDAVSVVLMSSPPRLVVGQPSYDRGEVAQEIDDLELTHGGADLAATLARVEEVLGRSGSVLTNKEVYFLTDLQRASWLPPEASSQQWDELRKAAGRLDEKATLVVIDLGQSDSPNLAVVDVSLGKAVATVASPSLVTGVVQNFARQPRPGVAVQLLVDGQAQGRQRIDLEPAAGTSVSFNPVFSEEGEHHVELRLENDPLDVDNHRWLALPVRQFLDVLCVNGKPSGQTFGQATAYLEAALAPRPASDTAISPVRPEVLPESKWWEVDLGRYACVFFCNVGQFTEGEYQRLRRYVEEGGAVIWFLGDQISSESYNRVLYRDGKGIFPLRLGGQVGDARQPQPEPFPLEPLGYQHPIVQPFQEQPSAGPATAHVYQYVRGELPGGTARVVLAYAGREGEAAQGGDPAIVEQPLGRGKVIVVTTSADLSWTTWPVSPSYVPMIHQMLEFAIGGRTGERTTMVGRPVRFAPPAGYGSGTATVRTPDGRSEPLRLDPPGLFQYPAGEGDSSGGKTDYSGVYEVDFGPAAGPAPSTSARGEVAGRDTQTTGILAGDGRPQRQRLFFAVNVDPRESDLAKLEVEELRRQVWPGIEFAYLTMWQNPDADPQAPVRHRGDLHALLLYAVLGLLFVEIFLAWRFGHYAS